MLSTSLVFDKAGQQTKFFKVPLADIYKQYPNGGAFILKLIETASKPKKEEEPVKPVNNVEKPIEKSAKRIGDVMPPEPPGPGPVPAPKPVTRKDKVNLERLILLKPQNIIKFDIKTARPAYQPGENVDLSVLLNEKGVNQPDKKSKDTYYATITVTDLSSFL